MKIKKTYSWHFWIPKWKVQIVISKSSYSGAVRHLKQTMFGNKICHPEFKFQFGELDLEYIKSKLPK